MRATRRKGLKVSRAPSFHAASYFTARAGSVRAPESPAVSDADHLQARSVGLTQLCRGRRDCLHARRRHDDRWDSDPRHYAAQRDHGPPRPPPIAPAGDPVRARQAVPPAEPGRGVGANARRRHVGPEAGGTVRCRSPIFGDRCSAVPEPKEPSLRRRDYRFLFDGCLAV